MVAFACGGGESAKAVKEALLNLYSPNYNAGMWRKYVKKEKEIRLFKRSFSYSKLTE